MSDLHKSLRLGDLLVEKGLISAVQLRQAIDLQKARYQQVEIPSIHTRHELGEILIELGFISRHQLNTNLSWQRRLKATTAIMVFVAPLLTAACGGGGGAGSSAGTSANNQTVNTSSQVVVGSAPLPSTVSSSSSSSKSSIATSAPKSSAASSSVTSGKLAGPVQLQWSVPTEREDGEYLDITEIGGYEIRYREKSDTEYKSVVIKDAFVDFYYFDYLQGDYEFEIATFDNSGLYSKFITVTGSD